MKILNKILNRLNFERWKSFKPTTYALNKSPFDGRLLKNTRVSNTCNFECINKLDIGDHVFIGHYNFIESSNGISIEEGCQITNYISILTHSSHISLRLYGKNYGGSEMVGYLKGSVVIGKYTFVGPHSVIMPGSKIGKGCIVSAYSMVNGNFPDFSVIAGNPAKVIGDTRSIDEAYLKQSPELITFYEEWAKS